MTMQPRRSSVWRLRLLCPFSPPSAFPNASWLLTMPPWGRWGSAANPRRRRVCHWERRRATIASLLLKRYKRRPCHRRASPSAVPIEAFWHVVYSWVCKHLYLYARSRRTSGQPWRPVSGPRPPLRSGAARASSPVPRDSQPPRLHTNSAVPIKRSATPFMRSTSGVSPCCSLSHRDRTPRRPSSMSGPASPSEHSSIRVRGRSASRPAGGPSR